jgi:hypothetical protein
MLRTTTPNTNENSQLEVPKKSYQVYNILPKQNSANSFYSSIDNQGSILISIYNNTNGRAANSVPTPNTEESMGMGNAWVQPRLREAINSNRPISRRVTMPSSSVSPASNFKATNERFNINHSFNDQENVRAFSTSPFGSAGHFSVMQSRLETSSELGQSRRSDGGLYNFKEWTRVYLFGSEHKTGLPRI